MSYSGLTRISFKKIDNYGEKPEITDGLIHKLFGFGDISPCDDIKDSVVRYAV